MCNDCYRDGEKAERPADLYERLAMFLPCLVWLRTYSVKDYLVVSVAGYNTL